MTGSKVISATGAISGDTLYLTSCDAWTKDIAVAELLHIEDVDWRLAFARRLEQRLGEVKQPTPVDAVEGDFGLTRLDAA